MRRCANRERQAPHQGHAAIKPHQLHRNLSLIVVHGQYRVKSAIFGTNEYRVRRIRSGDIEAALNACLYRWLNHVNFFLAKIAAIAGMRIERRNRNAGIVKTRVAQGAVGQRQLGKNTLGSNRRGDFGERDVGGDPCIPQILQNVELARVAGKPDHLGDETYFVVVAGIDIAHGFLVERRKTNRVSLSFMRHGERAPEILERKGAADGSGFTALYIRRGKMPQVDKDRAACCVKFRIGRHVADIKRHAGNLRAFLKDSPVAENDDIGCRPNLVVA
ncbi:MAG: hypothetical protein ACD_10C00712G0001 [uncultured bacterium]|nr:MAG: hypothetical protein ACD_10C00712G0001 [uncultured bacterium]